MPGTMKNYISKNTGNRMKENKKFIDTNYQNSQVPHRHNIFGTTESNIYGIQKIDKTM